MKKSITRSYRFAAKHKGTFALVLLAAYLIWPTGQPLSPQPYQLESARNVSYDQIEAEPMAMMAESAPAPRMAKLSAGITSGLAYANEGDAAEATEQKIIKKASISLEVKDTEVTRVQIEDKIKSSGGSVTNVNSWSVRPEVLGYNLQVRVPSEKLDQTLIDISKLGQKQSENISVRDITVQYQDTANQIKNLETRRDRLRTMMERETENLADVLSIDRELWSVQNQIENMTRTQKGRDRDVAFSQLNIALQPEPRIGDTDNPTWSVHSSWRQAVNQLIIKGQTIADRALQLVVFTPIWLPILLILIFVRRKFFGKK